MKYQPTWDSLARHTMPNWLRDAKFGIYTHWGPYSVPAHGENGSHYAARMYSPGDSYRAHHEKTWGDLKTFGYKDFIPLLTGENFDPDEWAQLFRDAGARFAGPVAVHHDNFAMWDSQITPWNAAQMGPKRDVVGELEKAIRGQGMRFITTFHHAHGWRWYPKDETFDTLDPACEMLYSRRKKSTDLMDAKFLKDWYGQIAEVVDAYDPDMIWFDADMRRIPDRYRREMMAYYFNKAEASGKEVTIAHKFFQLGPNAGIYDLEVGKNNELTAHPWLTDTTIDAGTGWSYVQNLGYKSPERLIHNLIDMVSKNGHLLLNVGPKADGSIPLPAKECLLAIGKWLSINGEAIYGTVPWVMFGEGPTKVAEGQSGEKSEVRYTAQDLRYTCKGDALYVTTLGRPGERVTCASFDKNWLFHRDDILKIEMLGGSEVDWVFDDEGLHISVPERVPSDIAVSFKVTTRSGI